MDTQLIAIGSYVPVTLQVSDGRGGLATQSYRIFVHPNPNNRPPVIVTTPQIQFDWAGPLNPATGIVAPQSIELDLAPGDVANPAVSVTVPAQLPMVDVFLLFDDTGSFIDTAPTLSNAFPQVIAQLQKNLPQVDFGFGVGRFEDYGGPVDWAPPINRPFILNQPILPASNSNLTQAIAQALKRIAPGGGGDDAETLIEALFQVATGAGFDGNLDGNLFGSGLAGDLETQTNPGLSGDVPPFLPMNFDSYRSSAINLPLDTATAIPAIAYNSLTAFKFQVQRGDAFRFTDSTNVSSSTGEWLVINPAGRLLSRHPRGSSFVESFEAPGEILLVPRTYGGTMPAGTLRRVVFEPTTVPLSFAQDTSFNFQFAGERKRFTFTLDQPTSIAFDAISADKATTWSLSDGNGDIFSSRLFGPATYRDSSFSISPIGPAEFDVTADQVHVLTPGTYTLTLAGNNTSLQTLFRASKLVPSTNVTAAINATTNIAIGKERLTWARVDGTPGQSITLSSRAAVILDADGLPLARPQSSNNSIADYGTLTFGPKATFWLGMTSDQDQTLPLTISQLGNVSSLPSADPIPLGTLTRGELSPTNLQKSYEIRLDTWQLVKVDSNTSQVSWRLQSMGGASWAEQNNIPFLGKFVLLPPGTHRLTVQSNNGLSLPLPFEVTVSAQPFSRNSYVTGATTTTSVLFGPGTRGGAGFRPGAIPIILAATDTGTAYEPDTLKAVKGVNGLELPLADLTSRSRGETAEGRGATFQRAVDALVAQGALVIGLGTNDSPSVAPRRTLEALSKLTGAINASTSTIDSNIFNDGIAPGDPFYFLINDSSKLASNVAAAIEAAVKSVPSNIDLKSSDANAGFTNLTGQRFGISPGKQIDFDTQFVGDGQAHVFDLQFTRIGTSEIVGSIPVAINDRYRYDSKAIDPDDDPVTLGLVGDTHGATFDPTTGKIRWRPTAPGSYTFTLRAADSFGGEDRQTWTVVVGDVRASNSAPDLEPFAPVLVTAGSPLRVQATASDANAGDQLSYAFIGPSLGGTSIPQGLKIDSTTGQIDWTPTIAQVGQARVTVRVTDAHGGFDDQSLVIEVVPPAADSNRTPGITSRPLRTSVIDRSYLYDVEAKDLDHDPLTYSLIIAPDGMVIDSVTGVIGWKPVVRDLGTHDVLVRVSDERGGVAFQSYELLVSQTNDPPEITSRPEGAAVPGTAWIYQVVANDPNGDPLSLHAGQWPAS